MPDLPVTDPGFGRPVPCACKAAAITARRLAKLDAIDGLTEAERGYAFGSERTEEQQRIAADLIRLVDEGWGMATLTGGFGVGKTYMLIAAVNRAKAAGQPAHYTTMRDLLQYLRRAFDPERSGGMGLEERWQLMMTAPVLAIDELDKANTTAWALEQFSALVDERWRMMRTHVTLFAMNASMSALPGDIADRLSDSRAGVFEMTGDSLRLW